MRKANNKCFTCSTEVRDKQMKVKLKKKKIKEMVRIKFCNKYQDFRQ